MLPQKSGDRKLFFFRFFVYAGMFSLSYIIFSAILSRSSSDLTIHTIWAGEGDFLNPKTFFYHGAHPLWHMLVSLLAMTGLSLSTSSVLVTTLLKVAELWLIQRCMEKFLKTHTNGYVITWAAVCCSLVACFWLPWYNPAVYMGVGSPNPWHSPTQLIAMVMMLLCVPYSAQCYTEFERLRPLHGEKTLLPWRKAIFLGALLFLSLTAKPTFLQAFLPAAGLFLLVQWIRNSNNSRFFGQILLVVLPSILFMLFQYFYYFGFIGTPQGEMTLEVSSAKLRAGFLSILLIHAFPLYVFSVCIHRKDFKDPLFTLPVLFCLMGVLEYLFLGETGRRAADGNFGWGMMGGALMLWVVTLPLFLRSYLSAKAKKRGKAKYYPGFAILLWHLFSGIYYIVYLLHNPINQ